MKPESICTKYSVPKTPPIGYFEAVLSPEGWENSRYVNDSKDHLRAEEIAEFSDVVRGFFHTCNTQNELKKFVKKHGKAIDPVTDGVRLAGALMVYIITISGYAITFAPYRKENA